MKARAHTDTMFCWWNTAGIRRADLAIKRCDGRMIWHRDISLTALPLPWARAENARGSEVYVRPARGYPWPLVFLDDVTVAIASRVAQKYDALAVNTSPAGGCHLWLLCSRALDEAGRLQAQRWLATRIGADLASTSGEHLGRLAGFKNWKRGGVWVNIQYAPRCGRRWASRFDETVDSADTLVQSGMCRCARRRTLNKDSSESAREWGWVCGRLEAGCDPRLVYHQLVERARFRRGDDAERYALRTIKQALKRSEGKGVPRYSVMPSAAEG